jgi:gamma-glutamylcyclotransferase (GGCT)/AIG2-like uncharacterized protein YtfP
VTAAQSWNGSMSPPSTVRFLSAGRAAEADSMSARRRAAKRSATGASRPCEAAGRTLGDVPHSGPMTRSPIILAVYGTLRHGEWNAPLLAGASYVGTGRISGRLREMRASATRAYGYPALVLDGGGEVVVELYELADAASLAAADELEAFDPADEAGSEYVRRAVGVSGSPAERAWVYVYNGPAAEMGDVIPGGDWVAHVASPAEVVPADG